MDSNSMILVVPCLVALILQISPSAATTTFTVGGDTVVGWTIPSSSSYYSSWASNNTFSVGDVLAFYFQTGVHTVYEVSKSGYDSCNATKPINKWATGPANVTITTAGAHYYICTIPTHCNYGQKLAINATATAASSPSPSASAPASATTSPPPPTSDATAATHLGFLFPNLLLVAAFAFFL